jgi:methionine-S-sulfoxide reductase
MLSQFGVALGGWSRTSGRDAIPPPMILRNGSPGAKTHAHAVGLGPWLAGGADCAVGRRRSSWIGSKLEFRAERHHCSRNEFKRQARGYGVYAGSETHFVNGHRIQPPFPEGLERAVFGLGCFWGAEKAFWQLPGVYSTAVGYAGGHAADPSYKQVCTGTDGSCGGRIGHLRSQAHQLRELLRVFWESHDPTQGMRQGNDVGTQYRSAIYAYDEAQLEAAEQSQARLPGGAETRRIAARSPPRSARRRRSITPRTITSSTWRRIRMGIARIIRAEFRINPRC